MFKTEDSTVAEAVQADVAALAAIGPFAQVTGAYADAGMPTVPCNGKRPIPEKWQKLTPEGARALIGQHGRCNVGVLAGEPSGVGFLDDDTGSPHRTDLKARSGRK